ncbi:YceD family protein [Paenibacillus sp. FA6]|uniref:YceD family protein n=1 Tax=Paenibacillus sp. FA6 TaxID=3413029 RepID=UPI003F65EE0F
MQFEFRRIVKLEGAMQFQEQVNVDRVVKDRKDIITAESVLVDLQASYVGGDTVEVQGKLNGQVEMACSRCLTEVHKHLNIPFHERFKLVKQSEKIQDEDDDIIYVDNDVVDLIPFVEEAFLLYLPQIPICKASCKGLCQKCGTDLNVSTCNCDTRVVDPRLAALKGLFE